MTAAAAERSAFGPDWRSPVTVSALACMPPELQLSQAADVPRKLRYSAGLQVVERNQRCARLQVARIRRKPATDRPRRDEETAPIDDRRLGPIKVLNGARASGLYSLWPELDRTEGLGEQMAWSCTTMGRRSLGTLGFAVVCWMLGGCGSKPDADAEPRLNFGACPSDLPGQKLGRTCATTQVPLRWDEPQGATIELLVARYRSDSPSRGQLWMLDGGPGGTGGVYMDPDILALYASLGLDVYVPQHRGTGHSTPLRCDDTADIPACGAQLVDTWGEGLRGFHSVEAGRDVGSLIERASSEPGPVFVFGLSYGSYWAQRYLQTFPRQAKGVILEGVFPLGEQLWQGDPLADAAARSLFEACRKTPACAAAFADEDAEDVARRVVANATDPAKRCLGDSGPALAELEVAFTTLIAGDLGAAIPGVIRRLDRCNDLDQEELSSLLQVLGQALDMAPDESIDNPALGTHVLRSDLLAEVSQFPLEDLRAARSSLIFWSGAASSEEFAAIVDGWPVNYPPAEKALPQSHSPVLMLNGGLDIQTPSVWARELASDLQGQLVEFPFAGHGVDISLASPFTAGDASCSLSMLSAFVGAPETPVDATCAATAYEPDVAGSSQAMQQLASALYGADTPLLGSSGSSSAKSLSAPAPTWSRAAVTAALQERIRRGHRSRFAK